MGPRRALSLFLLVMAGGTAFPGSAGIFITPPVITSVDGLSPLAQAELQSQINDLFATIQGDLNNRYFSKVHDLADLSRGFANTNTLAATVPAFPGVDGTSLFRLSLGTGLSLALPDLSVEGLQGLGQRIVDEGDLYAGVGVGGIAGRLELNPRALGLKNLSVSLKFGGLRYSYTGTAGSSFTFRQSLVGVGAQFLLVPAERWAGGTVQWQGLAVGTGANYITDEVNLTLRLPDQTLDRAVTFEGTDYGVTAHLTNLQAGLGISNRSLVVPLEGTTSVRLLWFLDLGLTAGVDLALPRSTIEVKGQAEASASVAELPNLRTSSAAIRVVATDTESTPTILDCLSPRIAVDVGLNLPFVRLDLPLGWAPATNALSLGLTAGFHW